MKVYYIELYNEYNEYNELFRIFQVKCGNYIFISLQHYKTMHAKDVRRSQIKRRIHCFIKL